MEGHAAIEEVSAKKKMKKKINIYTSAGVTNL